jgi:hypothetical protein
MPPFVSRFPANPYLQLTSSALNLLMTGKYFDVAVGDPEIGGCRLRPGKTDRDS